ncbi:hypothetical protein SMACR_01139 [Sordaria macrospora]|uniref:WGS project CABT00000000 data, contig 2.2 n=2 Tax=Sordaria macrospora TaxID=5147 RepID=F7VMD5_SORMK|nr:uncharacterized protein SMAC_01139 [Sordaria macrospora k-hell]KAA8631749.1 hypothetical protein SMACR_01139 [Sordaria macrospora]WPJ62374.1 hypothetical protein SMAC4_01139 [Sordaria macrospora]CCC07115.1 unnamed protein product [Sordaria macrospora k-hell]
MKASTVHIFSCNLILSDHRFLLSNPHLTPIQHVHPQSHSPDKTTTNSSTPKDLHHPHHPLGRLHQRHSRLAYRPTSRGRRRPDCSRGPHDTQGQHRTSRLRQAQVPRLASRRALHGQQRKRLLRRPGIP